MTAAQDANATGKMPVVFVGHGSPENAIMENAFTRRLEQLGRDLPRPQAILAVSAHWLTHGTYVTGMARPRTIHDFYGFPQEMYALSYPSPGAPEYAERVRELITTTGVGWDLSWGLDHGTWTVLRRMYPAADIPVFQLSIDYDHPPAYHYALAKELAPLRKEGVLILGSGNITHNLRVTDYPHLDAPPRVWAVAFDERVKAALLHRDHAALIHYQSWGDATDLAVSADDRYNPVLQGMSPQEWGRVADLAVPTNDHYLPMLYAAGLQEEGDAIEFVYEGFHYGTLSMRCFQIG
ncbi:MAG TPA: 4,5-DOPA dioxygenase extradiol [Anaerolineae bacterium]|nr:4,5-DOPA dioxygenase extradiol [Anaerolineae bacterium]HXK42229.1 4,5-DOPA dioxygenase extradiol [Anaerolineae bacterium]